MLKTKKELKEKIISRLISEFPLKVEEVELTATPDQLGRPGSFLCLPFGQKAQNQAADYRQPGGRTSDRTGRRG